MAQVRYRVPPVPTCCQFSAPPSSRLAVANTCLHHVEYPAKMVKDGRGQSTRIGIRKRVSLLRLKRPEAWCVSFPFLELLGVNYWQVTVLCKGILKGIL